MLKECRPFGARGLLVHGRSLASGELLNRLVDEVPAGLALATWMHPGGEPTLDHLASALAAARAYRADWIAAVGGGSVMDVGKACAGLMEAPLDPESYHDGAPIPPSRTPFIAVPTTAGTGGEATMVTVLTNARQGVKKSIRHPSFMPRVVILDPELLAGCPPAVIAGSGMDAFVQAVEAYVSKGATWFSDALALQAVRLIDQGLVPVHDGELGAPAQALMEGSFLAGLALSHARLGLVHGLAHPLGHRYHVPHGVVCAVCLPPVIAFNRPVAAEKYEALGTLLDRDLGEYAGTMLETLGIASPFRGQALTDRDAIIAETLASGSTAANPRPVTAADAAAILNTLFAA
ncbi:MAG: iron-containing alcohol dehydrogenase [Lentisphaerae bacterium]|nr:iron-containing alcohol dehydrogenase [Lentisphaerota bacterium]